jgi:Holliday junction DNA helicase RuvA
VALQRALVDDDIDALTLVPGVGKRTALRLAVELKARLDVPDVETVDAAATPSARSEVRAALSGLGYEPDEVRDVLAQVDGDGSVEELLRDALKMLAVARV